MLLSAETSYGVKMTCKFISPSLLFVTCSFIGKSFVEIVRHLFSVPGVDSFFSQRLCQDPLKRFFGCQRQRGRVNDNPNVAEFMKNTQAIRVIGSFCQGPIRGNCRGSQGEQQEESLVHCLSVDVLEAQQIMDSHQSYLCSLVTSYIHC